MESSNHQIITVSSSNAGAQWSAPKKKIIESESGLSLLARLETRPSLLGIDSYFLPKGPQLGDVIELSGKPGCGKSAFCLHLMASALLPKHWKGVHIGGCESGVIFVDTDCHFSILQLENVMQKKASNILRKSKSALKGKCVSGNEQELISNHESVKSFLQSGSQCIKGELTKLTKQCLKKFCYLRCTDSTQFAVTLLSINELLPAKKDVSLVIIDSISAFYWYDFSYRSDSWFKLKQYYNNIYEVFISYIRKYKVTLVATRQSLFRKKSKEDNYNKQMNPIEEEETGESVNDFEYMGKEWAKAVTHRVKFSFNESQVLGIELKKTDKPETKDNRKSLIKNTHSELSSKYTLDDRCVYCVDIADNERRTKLNFTIHEEGIRWQI
ncbi:hypothetical protein SK128_015231 [Halocaridina rubra]|uniref:RecA family profile 1 domain-containing protein n=1 Tax=Halocaridina rubra TaxID=373956 RepID=A0AAN9AFM2_HALRR